MIGERSLSRREVIKICGIGLLASPLVTPAGCGKQTRRAFQEPKGPPYEGTDAQLLDEIQRATFQFFWDEASQKTGQVKDRALANGNDSRMMSTTICQTSTGSFSTSFTWKPASAGRSVSCLPSILLSCFVACLLPGNTLPIRKSKIWRRKSTSGSTGRGCSMAPRPCPWAGHRNRDF